MEQEPITYEEFRTGLTYGQVYALIYQRRYKRRHGVLGAWREIKQYMYREYVEQFYYYQNKEITA